VAQPPSVPAAAGIPDDIVVMGQVVGPYGVRGWIKARTFSEDPGALLDHVAWWGRPYHGGGGDWRPWEKLAGRLHSDTLLAQLAGIENPEAALALKGWEIGVSRAALPPAAEGEIYWTDLVGLEVVNRDGVAFGRVVGVQEYGAHPVLRVARRADEQGPERLIPYVPAHIDRVDLAARRIEVNWGADY
jgi:16S rRNA processing protein RimM